jgi:exopolysaccharide biosynthesis polyprenyl glycosylphosphotransferase
MGHWTANSTWEAELDEYCSQYARMILGTPATPPTRSAFAVREFPGTASGSPSNLPATAARRRSYWTSALMHWLFPQVEVADRFVLYRLIAADFVLLSGICALLSRFDSGWALSRSAVPVYAVLVTLFGFSEGLYRNTYREPLTNQMAAASRSVLFALGLVLVAVRGEISFLAALVTGVLSFAGLVFLRRLQWFRWRNAARSKGANCRHVLIAGAGPAGRSIARALREEPEQPSVVRGFVDDSLPLSHEVLGRLDDLAWLTRAEFVDEVIVALPKSPARALDVAEMAYRNHLDIRLVPDLPPGPWPTAGVDHIGPVPVITLHREPIPSASLFLKRLLDIAGASVGLLLTAPIMAIVAVLIRFDSPGTILYAAERTGFKGSRFRCYKFRTMIAAADRLKEKLQDRNQRQGPIFKIDNDPRVTRIGHWLRRYSVDELPQLWNVLRGDMSLVGPRPHPVDEVNHYELHQFRRLDVKPGVTGLWQVTARNNPSFDLNMHLDLTYIENWSFLLDLRLLLKTVGVLFSPEGA